MLLTDFLLPLLLASFLLSFERITYLLIWRQPDTFMKWAEALRIAPDPVSTLERLFYGFKLLQLMVFATWILTYSDTVVPLPSGNTISQGFAAGLIVIGQILNLSTFWQLGRKGIFYGVRFGHNIPWCNGFPFSVCPHPQYLGTVMSIWGLFLLFLYPGLEWILIPAVQTVFYFLGAHFENSDADQLSSTDTNAAELQKAIE